MFSSFNSVEDCFITNRLGRIQPQITALQLSTLEDYIAQLTSLVNKVVSEDYQMQPLVSISAQTPAVVGDVVTNLLNINNDCGDIADEVERLENNASVLYNMSAAIQNSLRQQIREGIYSSSSNTFIEAFINQNQIDSSTGTIDFVAGRAMSSLINETTLAPSLSIGLASVGSTSDDISTLLSGDATSLFTWNGPVIEIVITFPSATVVNRLILTPDDYKGYAVTTLTTSPDGSLFTDVLEDLGVSSISTGPEAGKYSGATVIDFSPRSVSTMRLIITNSIDGTTIPLRLLSLTQRSYQPSATITSNPQTASSGQVLFQTDEVDFPPFTSVTHQISSDGMLFTTIQPGLLTLPNPWWYRAIFSRSSAAFTNNSTPLYPTTADPTYNGEFTLINSTSTVISTNTVERFLVLTNVTGVIPLRETPLPGTLSLQVGNLYLTNTQYSIDSNNNISFPSTMANVTISYQTSAQGAINLLALQNYYSSFLNTISFMVK
jgi:hypothetical protein